MSLPVALVDSLFIVNNSRTGEELAEGVSGFPVRVWVPTLDLSNPNEH